MPDDKLMDAIRVALVTHAKTGSGKWAYPRQEEVEPAVVAALFEQNVCRLLTVAGGRAFQAVLGDLSSLGFDARWERVSAASVGAPHLRDRLFLVGWAASSHIPHPSGVELRVFREWELGAPKGQQDQPRPSIAGDHGETRGWDAEPPLLGVADGLPAGVVRPQYRALGNAAVPEIPYRLGQLIVEAERADDRCRECWRAPVTVSIYGHERSCPQYVEPQPIGGADGCRRDCPVSEWGCRYDRVS